MYVYKITNIVNNKIYIGQHSTLNIDDGYLGSGKLLRLALKKYGKACFLKEVLCFCESQQELSEKETFFISSYNSVDKSIGYNICTAAAGHPQTESTRAKIGDSLRGIPKPEGFSEKISKPKGPQSLEHRLKNSEKSKGRKWYRDPNSEESKLCYPVEAPENWLLGRPASSMQGTKTEEAMKKWKESIKNTKPRSEEFREKMAKIAKDGWEKRKNGRNQEKTGSGENDQNS